jgi:hypothetical protein
MIAIREIARQSLTNMEVIPNLHIREMKLKVNLQSIS